MRDFRAVIQTVVFVYKMDCGLSCCTTFWQAAPACLHGASGLPGLKASARHFSVYRLRPTN